ncbi:hypothetical protein Pelo_4507 [Pelomyxa schiedti]|nr:hypothetical protein Pelo_4507 [Pelomyxa schiedti]
MYFDCNTAIGDDGAQCMASALSALSDNVVKLRRITLRQCGIGPKGILSLAKSALHSMTITMIVCDNCPIPRKKLTKVFSSQPKLLAPEEAKVRITVLGDGGIGTKSSLLDWFVGYRWNGEYDPSDDSYQTEREIDGVRVRINILDTAGCVSSLRERLYGDAFSLGYSITSRRSFDALEVTHSTLLKMKECCDYPKVIVAANTDTDSIRVVRYSEGKELARKLNGPFFEIQNHFSFIPSHTTLGKFWYRPEHGGSIL